MKILISNDDGVHARGLIELAKALSSIADITVVAPDRNRSAASHSLTLDRPLRYQKTAEGFFAVNGTPTDCVHLAITGLLESPPDMVVSGINHGANLGDDVLYSGTVAAAMEGRFLGLPAVALSLVAGSAEHFKQAAEMAKTIVLGLSTKPLATDTILNVNFPDLRQTELKGIQATRLGFRHRSEPVIKSTDPKGNEIFWLGSAGPEQDAGPGTDFHAINAGFASITPLHCDLTQHESKPTIESWVEAIQ